MKDMDCIIPVSAFLWNDKIYKTREAALKEWALDYFGAFFKEVVMHDGDFDVQLLEQAVVSNDFQDAVKILQRNKS